MNRRPAAARLPVRRPQRWVVALVVLQASLATGILAVAGSGPVLIVDVPPWWAFGGVAVAFALAETMVFDVEFRRQTASFSMAEVALAGALVLLGPVPAVLARIVGSGAALAARRVPPLKTAFNLSHFGLEAALAVWATRAVLPSEASTMTVVVTVGLACLFTSALGTILVSIVVSLYEGDLRRRLADELVTFSSIAFAGPTVGMMAVAVAFVDLRLLVVPCGLIAGLWIVLRAGSDLGQRFRDLSEAHGFARAIGRAVELDDIATVAVEEISRMVRAGRTALVLAGGPDEPMRHFGDVQLTPLARCLLDDPDAAPMAGMAAVRLGDELGEIGLLLVADRFGGAVTFSDDDRHRLDTIAEQLASSLRKGRLGEQIAHDARRDRLTGLPNRSRFEQLGQAILDRPEQPGSVGVIVADLARFKEINESLGHHVGDQLLIEVGRRIDAVASRLEGDVAARLGGDEFVLFVRRPDTDSLEALGRDLAASLGAPATVGDIDVVIGASVGLAVDDGRRSIVALLRQADLAMRAAKRNRIAYQRFHPDLEHVTADRIALIAELRTALEADTLDLYFQPQLELGSGDITGVEALVRWNHPTRGFVPPDVFVPLAEQSGLIHDLTRFVMRRAASAASHWRRSGYDITVAVNLSAVDLLHEGLVDDVLKLLAETQIPPTALSFEVTETSFMNEVERSIHTLDTLNALGCSLSVDDFGTGYSSLTYLRRLPVSEVKIDRSFVMDLMSDPSAEVIVKATSDLGHNLGLAVVAEGVETMELAHRLRSLGCDVAQGYGIARPMPLHLLDTWLGGQPVRRLDAAKRPAPESSTVVNIDVARRRSA